MKLIHFTTAILLTFLTPIAIHGMSVVQVSPTAQSLSAARNTQIMITFDQPVNGFFVSPTSLSIFGHWSGVAQGSVTYIDGNKTLVFTPTTSFNAGEWVCVSLSTTLRSISGEQLTKGYCWQFWIRPSTGNIELEETDRISTRESGEGHIQTYGAHGGDLNHDGFSDFFAPNEISNDCRVFINDGNGNYTNFEIYPIPNGSRPSTNESADFNTDGDLDLAVGNSTSDSITIFLGDGEGGFKSIKSYLAAEGIRGLAVSDMDGDGDADIVTANRAASNVAILHNDGTGKFGAPTLITANSNGETACATADANNDGILDVFVGAHGSGEISLLLGDGIGGFTFSDKISAGGGGTWMVATGDVNGDSYADVACVNTQSNNIGIVLSDGAGGLLPAVTYAADGFPIAIDLGDIDGDGDLDVMSSNYTGDNWVYYENDGTGTFINRRVLDSFDAASCATFHDRDNDGDLDMTGIDEDADLVFLFENFAPSAVDDDNSDANVIVYPNPSEDGWYVEIPDAGYQQIQLLDLAGKLLLTMSYNQSLIYLSSDKIKAGTYVLQVINAENELIRTQKVVFVQ